MTNDDATRTRRNVLKTTGAAAVAASVGVTGLASAGSTLVVETWSDFDQYAWGFSAHGDLEDLGGASSVDVFLQAREDGTSTWDHESPRQTFSSAPADFTATVTGLSPSTTYDYRMVAEASDGDRATGETKISYTQEDDSPKVSVSSDAVSTTDTTARLLGWIDDLGGADEIEVFFYYGESGTSLDQESAKKTFDARPYNGDFTIDVSGLDPDTTYDFRAVGNASDGESDISDGTGTFTTDK